MAVIAASPAAIDFGCLAERIGIKSSMTGADASSSISRSSASSAFALAAGRADGRPFSAMAETVTPRVLILVSSSAHKYHSIAYLVQA